MLSYKRYAEVRDEKGMTDNKVSGLTGIGTSTLSEWKYGRYTPKADKILKISKLLGISLEEAFGED